jgi:hypothetical protein
MESESNLTDIIGGEVYMNAKQIALPFRSSEARQRKNSNLDLLNRSYADEEATVTVIGICPDDESRVMVQRDLDGRIWSMPAWLMRLIFLDAKNRRAA